jgi:hypothetical protein
MAAAASLLLLLLIQFTAIIALIAVRACVAAR